MALLFLGYFWTTSREQEKVRKQKIAEQQIQKTKDDSIAKLKKPIDDSLSRITDSVVKVTSAGSFQGATDSVEKTLSIENDLIKVTLTNKGGQVKKVELKKYRR